MTDPPQSPASQKSGGFFQSSTARTPASPGSASSARSPHSTLGLPHPRRQPFRPGSAKEELVRRYVSDLLLQISRRFVKRYGTAAQDDHSSGYRSMGELCRDVDALLSSLWKSGTPNLQVQYLLSIANEFITWLNGFQPSPRATLDILRKLDFCFASLLIGEDLETHETLPGFETGGNTSNRRVGLSRTDIVRCRSIAEQSRIAVVDVFRRGPPDPLDESEIAHHSRRDSAWRAVRQGTVTTDASTIQGDDTDLGRIDEHTDDDDTTLADESEDDRDGFSNDYDDESNEDMQMGIARVYENTLTKLGEILGDPPSRIGDFAPENMCVNDSFEDENDDEY
ncbi:hypothetical protein SEPCBS119000_003794 [Sporothrix epigloea]|uniref:Meiotic recombination protein DMC1 n=1 Tax=Sporothrix epigloea TaxID=1892477 RepID=A0ABP0DS99_9PEZI